VLGIVLKIENYLDTDFDGFIISHSVEFSVHDVSQVSEQFDFRSGFLFFLGSSDLFLFEIVKFIPVVFKGVLDTEFDVSFGEIHIIVDISENLERG